MKKIVLILALLSITAFAVAQLVMIKDYEVLTADLGANVCTGGWNPSTNHHILVTAATDAAPVIYNGSDGSDASSSLSMTGLSATTSGLGIFALGCGPDGVIFGFYETTDDPPVNYLVRWADESASPTDQAVADMGFVRAFDVHKTGTDTVIAVVGSVDYGPVYILTTTDGTTFAKTDEIADMAKNGVAVDDDLTVAYAAQIAAIPPVKSYYDTGTSSWVKDTVTWAPDAVGDDGASVGAIGLGYDATANILYGTGVYQRGGTGQIIEYDEVFALDGDTGATLGSIVTDNNCEPYSNLDVSADGQTMYWQARSMATSTVGVLGKVVFPTPTPTPIAASSWDLYE